MNNNSVSIGPSTLAGWGTALTAFLGAVIAYLTGSHTAQSVTAVELAGIGALSGGITQLGRYFQAHKYIAGTEIIHHVEDVTDSKSSNTILTEINKISHDIIGIIKDPKSLVEDFHQDEEIAHDIDTLATSAVPTTPDGDNSKVQAVFDQQTAAITPLVQGS